MLRAVLIAVLAAAVAAPLATSAPDAGAAQKPKARLKAFESCSGIVRYARRNTLRTVREIRTRQRGVPQRAEGLNGGGDQEGAGGGGEDFSGTNVQEAGVDEPDIVKTDGTRLLVLTRDALHAIDPRSTPARRLDRLPLGEDTYGHELLLHGTRALVISQFEGELVEQTQLTEVDVSLPGRLRVIRTMTVDGDHLSSRLTGTNARVVLRSIPRALTAGMRRMRRARLAGWMPRAVLERRGTKRKRTSRAVACRAVRRTAKFSGANMITVLTIDMAKGLPAVDADALMTDADTVYASPDGLFVATQRWPEWVEFFAPPDRTRTDIHRFDTAQPGTTTYRATGTVSGYLLSQWALSEHAGHLRVATTEDRGGRDSESHVTVLREQEGRLVPVGKVSGLGRGERIFAVRFIGDVGYVVTFRQVDPLYTLDLADPAAPKVLGELKILGYSAYLHPLAGGLLLGVGQDATEQGELRGTQLSLFDVANPRSPTRLQQHTLDSGSSSAVEWDHRAFLFWPPTGLTVVPYERWNERTDEYEAGAVALRTGRDGIAPLGRITHRGGAFESQIQRSVVIGDRLFTVSESGLMAAPLGDPANGSWLPL
jgi:uncharacterized secreted protein with C-terminal beta-propeller domain